MLVGELVVLAIFIVIGIVALAQGKGQRLRLHADLQRRHVLAGRWSSARSRSRCCRSSASTASRCWPRRTRTSARAIGRSMIAALLLAGVLFIVQTWVAALLVPDPADADRQRRPGRHRVLRRRRRSPAAPGWPSSPRSRPRSPGASPTRWWRRPRRPGCSTRWPGTGSCRRSWRRCTRRKGVPGQRHPAGRGRLAGRSGSTWPPGTTASPLLCTLVNFGALTAFLVLHVSVVWHYVGAPRAAGTGGGTWSSRSSASRSSPTCVINANVAAPRRSASSGWPSASCCWSSCWPTGRRPSCRSVEPDGRSR